MDYSERFLGKYKSNSLRKRRWDYASHALYFVTICTKNRHQWFGKIENKTMQLSPIGKIAAEYWSSIPIHDFHAKIDHFIIMPDHIHGIVMIENKNSQYIYGQSIPLEIRGNRFGPLQKHSLQSVIHSYKSSVTRWCRKNGYEKFNWQPRYREDLIYNKTMLQNVRRYVLENPHKWKENAADFMLS